MNVAVILWGPTQVGKSSMLANVMDAEQGSAPEVGDGSGESVTCTTDLRRSALGPLLDCPGINDSRLLFTNEEAGQRVAVGVAEANVSLLKFLVFESMSSDAVQLRNTLAALVTTFGQKVMDGVVVVVSKADMRKGVAAEKRLAQIRKVLDEQGLKKLVVWQNEGLDSDQHEEQLEECKSALSQVSEVSTDELSDLWEKQKVRAQLLFDKQLPHIQEVEVEEEFAEPYDFQEAYTSQEPYKALETQTVMVKQTQQCSEQATNQYAFWIELTVRGVRKPGERHEKQPWKQVVQAFHDLDNEIGMDKGTWYLVGQPSLAAEIYFVVHDGSKIAFQSVYETRIRRWSQDILRRAPGSFKTKTVTKEVSQAVQVSVKKYREKTLYRTVVRYRTAQRTVLKAIENKHPVESFYQQALQQVMDEIRATFSSGPSDVSVEIHPEDSVSQVAIQAATLCEQGAGSVPEDSASWAVVDFEGHPPASWVSDNSGPHCFMPGTLFKTTAGPHLDFFLQCQDLVPGSRIVAADDLTILEVTKVATRETDHVVMLKAGDAVLRVTPCHRVVAFVEGSEAVTEDVCAGKLQKGRRILGSGGVPMELTDVQTLHEKSKVLEIAFMPDEPVEAFEPPAAILSKGQIFKKNSIRRGGMNKRGKTGGGYDCHESMPKTAPGEYED